MRWSKDSDWADLPLTLEDKILLQCTKPYLSSSETQYLQHLVLQESLDWDQLISKARDRSCITLLYWHLKAMPKITLPQSFARIRRSYSRTSLRSTYMLKKLGEILKNLGHKGAAVIVLKGAALAELVYPHFTLRRFSDIDLLIRPKDWPQVKDTLTLCGYQAEKNWESLGEDEVGEYAFAFRHIKFSPQIPHPLLVPIEIHFHVHWKNQENELWERAKKVKIAHADALVLCPEDFLAHLAIHLAHHNFSRLKWFADICALLTVYHNQFDWEFLSKTYRHTGIGLSLYYVLKLTQQLLDYPIPDGVLEKLTPSIFRRKLFEWMWNEKEILTLTAKDKTHQNFRSALTTVDEPIKIAKFIVNSLLPPPRWLRSRYTQAPKNLLALYFLHFSDVLRHRL